MQTAEIIALATENHLDIAAFAAFLNYESFDDDADAVEAFEDCYAGTWESLTEWAENFVEDAGMLSEMPENLRCYFDYAAFARDCDLNGDLWTADLESGDIAVFWRR